MESLFSLEIIINFIKISHEKITCLFPCVAFRLLDYPTIAINLLDDIDAKQLKLKLELNQELNKNVKINCFKDLLDKHGRYIFAKGKSCLFRSELDILYGHLQNAPVYLMLLDTYHEPYKLIGTSSVPLTTVMNEIYEELNSTDLDMPCTKLTHGVFDLKNLMGDDIGHISLAFRLSSFGSSLLPHIGITDEAVERQKALKMNIKQMSEDEVLIKNEVPVKLSDKPKVIKSHIETIPIDYKNSEIQISTTETSNVPIPAVRQPQNQQIKNIVIKRKTTVEDEFVFNYYCPPPLHYNSENPSVRSQIKIQDYEQKRIEYLAEAVQEQILEYKDNDLDDNDTNSTSVEEVSNAKMYQKPIQQQQQQLQQQDNFQLDQFPILKSLMDEISRLKLMTETNSLPNNPSQIQQQQKQQPKPQNKPVHSPRKTSKKIQQPKQQITLVGILKDTKKFTSQKLDKESLHESVNRLSQPRLITPRKTNMEQQEIKDETRKTPRKKKLKYGLTNTHRMRVFLNKPSKIDQINDEHLRLSEELKLNLNEIIKTKNSNEFINRLQRSQLSVSNSTGNSKSSTNLSLLNKVEMESTIDYAMSRNLFTKSLNTDTSIDQQLQQTQNSKFVQFGDTYILNHQTTDDSVPVTPNTATSTTTTSNNNIQQPLYNNENNFVKKNNKFTNKNKEIKNMYSYDFESSSTNSKQTNDFENYDDDEDDDNYLKMSQIKLNSDYLDQMFASSSTKYSNEDLMTNTKSMDDFLVTSKDTLNSNN